MPDSPHETLRVSVLGPVRAWYGDRELHLGPARQRALFAVLVADANRLVSRDDIIGAVWGTTPPATAPGNVYTYISGLRRALAPGRDRSAAVEVLTSGPNGYSLRIAAGHLDSDRYEQLCAEAGELHEAGDVAAAAARLDEARRLWHGEAYAGLTGDRIELERTRLTERRLAAAERQARIAMELNDDGLIGDLAGLVRDYPLHEPLHELLMLALYRAGRPAEALEAFQAARRTLVTELSVEPGPRLRALQRRVLDGSVAGDEAPTRGLTVVPTQVAQAIREGIAEQPLFGRADEVALLRNLTRRAAEGHGAAVWIEGEPGIGKTELLTRALSDANAEGCRLCWGVADELDQHVPLQVVTRALGLASPSADPRRAADAFDLHAASAGGCDDGGPGIAAERILAYLRTTCATTPVVLVVDDLQWADEATVLLWDRLVTATRHLPLLLVAATRPEPNGRDLTRLRHSVRLRDGHVLVLDALPPEETEELIAAVVGAPVGPHLRAVVGHSGGNPLCAREMAAALVRRGVVAVTGGRADIDASVPVETPESLLAVVRTTLDFLGEDTQEVLRMAALLGAEFAVEDVVAVTGRTPFELVPHLEEALAANVVVNSGCDLAFRHPFLRAALYDSIPRTVRTLLHRRTAEVLARGGSPVTRVAEQLAAETPVVDEWVVSWLAEHHAEVVKRVPEIACTLIRRVLGTGLPSPAQRERLLIALVKLDFRYGRYPIEEAQEAHAIATDRSDRAETLHLLAAMRFRRGHTVAAITLLTGAVEDPDAPEIWRTRHRMLLANFRRGSLDDLDRADARARQVHEEALAAARPYEAAFALQTTWLTNSIRRDHERALEYVDRALDIMRDHASFAGMYFDLLDNRMFTLQNLDRLDEAERTLREAALFAIRHRIPASLQVASAVQYYWLGRWDDATAEVSAVADDAPGITFLGMREPGAVTMLLHGVAALIAGHRQDQGLAAAHLDAANALPVTDAERESCDFLLVARALVAEQQGRPGDALDEMAPLLTPQYAPMMLRHQWLPDALRLALRLGRGEVAERAAAICAMEARKEVRPARAYAAAARCRALMTGDPAPALQAAGHYRAVGRVPELAAALEDAAVLLAAARRPHESARVGAEAAELYTVLGARWDLHRTRERLDEYGIDVRRGPAATGTVR
ncbi:BTAD domain-containing putative transcriptional regulator [Couchioplanes caeruleus]|uniref:SARP family transcriptional regulator n=2 Tax=Couchioplanes caeruleus TaxID=56438 RepID=A0A1K0FGI3_9ACTN|nr:BTAD domain-containing putative transcriptional regulator [Couchioplanes caeruleus]OJF11925.1 SARP family transcriptional regulator [Couchioplanes caeruleus subsp. caeruleus]ROP30587.1 transcriptional regulator [Couchioplanes caeruleus]